MPKSPTEDFVLDVRFPPHGIDRSKAQVVQRPGTTHVGQNVRFFEPRTERGRGGSRPGLARFIPVVTVETDPQQIQDLNVIVYGDGEALELTWDPMNPNDFIEDPSSAGPPESWGTGPIPINDDFDDLFPPTITGTDLETRVPGGPDGSPRRVRDGGTATPGGKNTLTHTPTSVARKCFRGSITVVVTKPPPDPGGFNGQLLAFTGTLCAPYAPPAIPGPTTGLVTKLAEDLTMPAGAGTIPQGTLMIDAIAAYLGGVVGSDSFGTVTIDLVSLPGSTCIGSGVCTGSLTADQAGTGGGAIINAG